jgi:hypothetical protein
LFVPSLAAAQQKSGADEKEKKEKDSDKPKGDEGVTPTEDLMREHGLLNRVLLIYDHHLQMLAAKRPFDGSILASAAEIIAPSQRE